MILHIIEEVSRWAIPLMIFIIPLAGFVRGVKVYEAFIEGAQEGFDTAVRIIPYLVAMLVSIGIFRESGALSFFVGLIQPAIDIFKIPGEVLPLAMMRPLSGGGALGIAADLINYHGPDSFIGRLASTMQGSTDTTFYVLTVYFGSVGIFRYRYSPAVGIIADLTGLLAAVFICRIVFG